MIYHVQSGIEHAIDLIGGKLADYLRKGLVEIPGNNRFLYQIRVFFGKIQDYFVDFSFRLRFSAFLIILLTKPKPERKFSISSATASEWNMSKQQPISLTMDSRSLSSLMTHLQNSTDRVPSWYRCSYPSRIFSATAIWAGLVRCRCRISTSASVGFSVMFPSTSGTQLK